MDKEAKRLLAAKQELEALAEKGADRTELGNTLSRLSHKVHPDRAKLGTWQAEEHHNRRLVIRRDLSDYVANLIRARSGK